MGKPVKLTFLLVVHAIVAERTRGFFGNRTISKLVGLVFSLDMHHCKIGVGCWFQVLGSLRQNFTAKQHFWISQSKHSLSVAVSRFTERRIRRKKSPLYISTGLDVESQRCSSQTGAGDHQEGSSISQTPGKHGRATWHPIFHGLSTFVEPASQFSCSLQHVLTFYHSVTSSTNKSLEVSETVPGISNLISV